MSLFDSLILLPFLALLLHGYSLGSQQSNSVITNTNEQVNVFADAKCQNIDVLFDGKLQNANNRSQSLDVQFGLTLEVNFNDKRVYVTLKHWNESLTSSDDVYFAFCSVEGCAKLYSSDKAVASIPVSNQRSEFALDLFSHNSQWFRFRLMDFPTFLDYFTLIGSKDQCTNSLLGAGNNQLDQSLYRACACCTGHTPLDLKMNCPINWETKNSPTQQPSDVTTKPNLPSTTEKPQFGEITCKKLIGYFAGQFQIDVVGSHSLATKDRINAEFELSFDASLKKEQIYGLVQNINQSVSLDSESVFFIMRTGNKTNRRSKRFGSTYVAIPFVTEPTRFWVDIGKTGMEIQFDLFFFENFNNSFTLNNAIGQCANKQLNDDYDAVTPDPSLYNYCFCCGDTYNPHPALNCPKNPWA